MNRQKFQNIKSERIDEISRRYLNKKGVRNIMNNKAVSHNQMKECFSPFPEDAEDKIVSGVLLVFMGINQMMVEEKGGSITETLTKRR